MSRDRPVLPLLMVIPLAAFGSAGSAQTATGNPSIELVTICHHAGPGLQFAIQVDEEAVPGHAVHGDTPGACDTPQI